MQDVTPTAAELSSASASHKAGLELQNVFTEGISASRRRLAPAKSVQIGIAGEFGRAADKVLIKYTFECKLFAVDQSEVTPETEEDNLLGTISVDLVLEYSPSRGTEPSDEDIAEFATEAGLTDAFPYMRETLTSMSSRLGFSGVTLGAIISAGIS